MKDKICEMCGGKNTTTGRYCNACYGYLKLHPEGIYNIPEEGKITYAPNGDPICHICGQAHRKLGNHIRFKHHMEQNEYRDKFKLYRNTRLSNMEYQETMADYNRKYRDIVVKENLIEKGKGTRIIKGQEFKERRKYGRPIKEVFVDAQS